MTDFHTGLAKNPANYQPLTPIDFIERTAQIYPNRTAIIYDDLNHNHYQQTWSETFIRCQKLAAGLKRAWH